MTHAMDSVLKLGRGKYIVRINFDGDIKSSLLTQLFLVSIVNLASTSHKDFPSLKHRQQIVLSVLRLLGFRAKSNLFHLVHCSVQVRRSVIPDMGCSEGDNDASFLERTA